MEQTATSQESSWITQETETATPDDKPKYFSTTGAVPARPRRSAGPEAFLDGGPKCLAPGHSRDTLNPLACLKPNRHNHTIGAIPPFSLFVSTSYQVQALHTDMAGTHLSRHSTPYNLPRPRLLFLPSTLFPLRTSPLTIHLLLY